MKAEINGIRLEGTPAEIADYVRLVNEKKEAKPITTQDWWLELNGGDSTKTLPFQIPWSGLQSALNAPEAMKNVVWYLNY